MFMSGITIPYSLGKFLNGTSKTKLYFHLAKRFIILWILGMVIQGNLLGFDPTHIYLYSNVLQAIALGYIFSAIIFLHFKWKAQLLIAITLLVMYWGAMEFITIGEYGGGNYSPQRNLAEYIERIVLGRFRDCADVVDGEVVFNPAITYTWVLSSLNFIVSVLTGVFAGEMIRSQIKEQKKMWYLVIIGILCICLGYGVSLLGQPIIKHIWTSSYTLVTTGICYLLLSMFYYWIDFKGHNRHLTILKLYGLNSITAYVLCEVPNFTDRFTIISNFIFQYLEPYLNNYYHVLITTSNSLIIMLLLFIMYKKNIFLRA